MYSAGHQGNIYSGYQKNQFYLPVSSSSTRRNEIWERKREKKGVNAPNSSNKKYQRVAGLMSSSYDRFSAPSYGYNKPKPSYSDYKPQNDDTYKQNRDQTDVYGKQNDSFKTK